jgi:hypothetical protein
MIKEKLTALENKIHSSTSMKQENKDAVLTLLAELQEEINEISNDKVAKLVELQGLNELQKSTEEDSGLLKSALNEVSETVNSFEESHPKLVQVVNSICTQLSNSGF